MRVRTRSYAVAFAAGAAVAGVTVQQQQLLQPPLAEALFLTQPRTRAHTRITTIRRCDTTHNRKNHPNQYSLCRTASRTDSDTETETISIRRKSYGAPVVDSTLLRFVSQQKKMPDVFRERAFRDDDEDDEAEAMGWTTAEPPVVLEQRIYESPINTTGSNLGNGVDASDYDSTTNAIKEKLANVGSLIGDGQESGDDVSEDNDFVLADTPTKTDPATESWMAQFGCQNIAQHLLSLGDVTDEASARTAGDAVERYCVVRTARRRIRRFLKERDNLWAASSFSSGSSSSSSRSELESLAASDMATSPAASLLLSYAEQQERQRLAEKNGGTASGDEDGVEATPSYSFGDVVEVMRDYGLTGNDICVLLTHSPNLALRVPRKSFLREGRTDNAETLEETLERSLRGLLVSTLGLRRYDARKVLRTCPGLLSVRGSKAAVEVVTIMTKLGVSEKSLARDKSSLPVLLSRSPAGLFRLVAFLSSTAIRMPLEQIGPLLRRRVGRDLMDALLPVPNTSYSKIVQNGANNIAENGANAVTTNATTSVVGQASSGEGETTTTLEDDAAAWSRTRAERQERIERTYASMMQTAMILKAQIGTQDLSKVVSAYPNVLLLDAEKQILPVARYLMGGLGIWQNDLSGVLQLYPTLLGTKIEDLERVVSYTLTLGVDEDDLAGIFRAFPGLFALPIEDMEGVVSYLKSIGVEDIGAFVTKLPPVLGYSVEKELRPKWEFLKTVCLQPEFELKEFPAYFSYPFDRVIKTRFNYLAYKGISIRFVSMRIDTVLRFGDLDFATKVALDDDDGEAFRMFASTRGANRTPQKLRKKKKNFRTAAPNANANVKANRQTRQNEARAALAAAQRLSEDIDNAKNLAELNRVFREAAPLRNRSLGNSLPSLSPSRPKRKKRKSKQQQQQQQPKQQQQQQRQKQRGNKNNNKNNNNNNNNRGQEGTFPFPA